MRTIEPCCSSAIHHAWRLHSRLHLGRKCRLEKVALVVRRSEAAGWRWSSSTLNECKPRFLGVAVMHWARPMAAELRDSRSGRRQGSSSDISSVREKARIALIRKGSSWAFKENIMIGASARQEPGFRGHPLGSWRKPRVPSHCYDDAAQFREAVFSGASPERVR